MAMCPYQLHRLHEIAVERILSFMAVTNDEKRKARTARPHEYGFHYGYQLLIFTITLVYSADSPIIVICGLGYYCTKHCVDKWNILNVRPNEYANTNGYAGMVLGFIIIAVLIFQAAMGGFFIGHIHASGIDGVLGSFLTVVASLPFFYTGIYYGSFIRKLFVSDDELPVWCFGKRVTQVETALGLHSSAVRELYGYSDEENSDDGDDDADHDDDGTANDEGHADRTMSTSNIGVSFGGGGGPHLGLNSRSMSAPALQAIGIASQSVGATSEDERAGGEEEAVSGGDANGDAAEVGGHVKFGRTRFQTEIVSPATGPATSPATSPGTAAKKYKFNKQRQRWATDVNLNRVHDLNTNRVQNPVLTGITEIAEGSSSPQRSPSRSPSPAFDEMSDAYRPPVKFSCQETGTDMNSGLYQWLGIASPIAPRSRDELAFRGDQDGRPASFRAELSSKASASACLGVLREMVENEDVERAVRPAVSHVGFREAEAEEKEEEDEAEEEEALPVPNWKKISVTAETQEELGRSDQPSMSGNRFHSAGSQDFVVDDDFSDDELMDEVDDDFSDDELMDELMDEMDNPLMNGLAMDDDDGRSTGPLRKANAGGAAEEGVVFEEEEGVGRPVCVDGWARSQSPDSAVVGASAVVGEGISGLAAIAAPAGSQEEEVKIAMPDPLCTASQPAVATEGREHSSFQRPRRARRGSLGGRLQNAAEPPPADTPAAPPAVRPAETGQQKQGEDQTPRADPESSEEDTMHEQPVACLARSAPVVLLQEPESPGSEAAEGAREPTGGPRRPASKQLDEGATSTEKSDSTQGSAFHRPRRARRGSLSGRLQNVSAAPAPGPELLPPPAQANASDYAFGTDVLPSDGDAGGEPAVAATDVVEMGAAEEEEEVEEVGTNPGHAEILGEEESSDEDEVDIC